MTRCLSSGGPVGGGGGPFASPARPYHHAAASIRLETSRSFIHASRAGARGARRVRTSVFFPSVSSSTHQPGLGFVRVIGHCPRRPLRGSLGAGQRRSGGMTMRRAPAGMIGALALAGCSFGADVPVAEKAIAAFHTQLDAAQFGPIYAQAADEMKKDTTQAQLADFLAAVHRKLGPFKSSKSIDRNVFVFFGVLL